MTDENTITPPRKRGRPSNADLAARAAQGGGPVPPSAALSATPVPDASLPGKRGPKPGRRKKGMSVEDQSNLSRQIIGLHQIAAMATGIPELQVGEKEAELLASALANVSAEYGLSLSGKTGATLQLLGVAAMIYLPRLSALKTRVAAKKAQGASLHAVKDDAPADA